MSILLVGGITLGVFVLGLRQAHNRLMTGIRAAFNANEIARIESSIGDALLSGCPTNEVLTFIGKKFQDIHIGTNGILDFYRNEVRWIIKDQGEIFWVGVYSSGEDGTWETRDDQRREGGFHKTSKDEISKLPEEKN